MFHICTLFLCDTQAIPLMPQRRPSLHKVPHDSDRGAPIATSKVVPVIEVVKKLVELVSLRKARRLWNVLMVRSVERAAETTKHGHDAQLVLRVAVEGGGVEYDWSLCGLGHVATP